MKKIYKIMIILSFILVLYTSFFIIKHIQNNNIPSLDLINNNYHDITKLVNPIANVQKISSIKKSNLKNLSVAYIDLSSGINATRSYKNCVKANVVPTFYISTKEHVKSVAIALDKVEKYDANVITNSTSIAQYMREKNYLVRIGLIYDLAHFLKDNVISSIEEQKIHTEIRSSYASFIVIDAKYANKDVVYKLQQLQIPVWVNINSKPGTDKFKIDVITSATAGVNGVISESATYVSNILNTVFSSNTISRIPVIFGHSGNPAIAAENTIESFKSAYINGADFLELDVQITSDDVIVILHDNSLNRTTNYTGEKSINEMTWEEVQKYHVLNSDGTSTEKPIPTLEELIKYVKGKDVKLYIEFKNINNDLILKTIQLLQKHEIIEQTSFISFYPRYFGNIFKELGHITVGTLFENKEPSDTYEKSLILLNSWINTAQFYKSVIGPGNEVPISRHLIQAATDRGTNVNVWVYGIINSGSSIFVAPNAITTDNINNMANMTRNVYAEDFSMYIGEKYNGNHVKAEQINHKTYNVSIEDTVISIITGDSVIIENGKLTAVKQGKSIVIFGQIVKTYPGEKYIVYSQPVTITVNC